MAQTPCLRVDEGFRMDRIFAADAKAGEIVLVGTKPTIVTSAVTYSAAQPNGTVDVRGMWDIPQKAETIAGGDAVYWDPTGNPYGGTVGSGAATAVATAYPLGRAAAVQPNGTATTAATDTYVRVLVENFTIATTVGGAVTASDIEAEDSSLGINGLDTAQGGAIAIAGGTSSTTGNAGGAVTVTGGTGGATGNGGAASLSGGVPGATSGTGGAVAITGGATAALAGTNYTGGAVSATGGSGKGSGAGGAASLVGGAGGATGTGGAIAVTGGASAGASGTAGAVAIDSGAATGGTGAGVNVGTTNATTVDIGNASSTSAAGGIWTFAKMFRIPVNASVAVGGTAQANANAVGEGFTVVTGADDTAAVKLPAAVAGAVVIIKSSTASKNLVVFPGASDAINALSANASYNFTSDAGMGLFIAADATTWYSLPLDA